jgi:hypothetical protein
VPAHAWRAHQQPSSVHRHRRFMLLCNAAAAEHERTGAVAQLRALVVRVCVASVRRVRLAAAVGASTARALLQLHRCTVAARARTDEGAVAQLRARVVRGVRTSSRCLTARALLL